MAFWGARMAAVQHAAQLSSARLSLVLLAAALGLVAGLTLGGRLARPESLPALAIGGGAGLAGCLAVLGQCTPLASLHTMIFLVTGLVLVVLVLATASQALTLAGPGQPVVLTRPGADDGRVLPAGKLWLLGAPAAAIPLGEGAAADWAAVQLHSLYATTAVSATAFALYSAAITAPP